MAVYEQIGTNTPDGMTIGADSSDKVSLYGVVPVVQASAITALGTTASTTATPAGFGTTTQADAIITAVNSIITALKNVGVIA